MVFGPCGGVTGEGRCEVDGRTCPFVATPAPHWTDTAHDPRPIGIPNLIVDIRPDLADPDFDASIDVLRRIGVAGLIGDHLDDPVGVSGVDAVRRVVAHGLAVIATVACRDRTPDDCREAIDRRLTVGADVVLCVTGDHPAARFGPAHSAEFALDSVRLTALARASGALVAVAESPASEPVDVRAERMVDKQRAGADLAILNHAGDVDALVGFAADAGRLGAAVAMAAPVPVITDRASLEALTQFPGVVLPESLIGYISTADDPSSAGIDAAVGFGRAVLESGRFTHLNLSGRATNAGQLARSHVMAAVAIGIRADD